LFSDDFNRIYTDLMSRARKHKTLAVQDHYEYWAANRERAECGKLFLLDRRDRCVHQIFFDDNLHLSEYAKGKGIVDARDAASGESLPVPPLMNRHLVKVEPLLAILQDDYYVRALGLCEENFQQAEQI